MKSKFFLLFCAFIFLSATFKILQGGLAETWNKVSADDHYAWILKIPQLTDCLNQDCRFIRDTQEQLKVDFSQYSYDLNYKRWREQHCLHDVYTFLYTVQMSVYEKLFNLPTRELAYQWVAYTGYALVSLSLLFFLVTIFGAVPAGIALLILAFGKWGIPFFGILTPSFFITGISFCFATLFIRTPKVFLKLLPIIIIFMSLYHSIGKLYSVGFIVLAGLHYYKQMRQEKSLAAWWLASVASLGLMALLGFVEQPQFKLASFPFLTYSEILAHFEVNVKELLNTFSRFFYAGGLHFLAAGLINLILISLLFKILRQTRKMSDNRINVLYFYYFLALFTVFHFFKNHPGELTGRMIIPFAVCLYGAIAYLARHIVFDKNLDQKTRLNSAGIVVLFLINFVFVAMNPPQFFTTPPEQQFYTAQNNLYSPAQISKVFDEYNNCGSILYLDQTPMWVYSTYGTLKCGAILGHVWPDNDQVLAGLIANRQDLKHAVAFNPIHGKIGQPVLHKNKVLILHFKNPPQAQFKIKLKTNSVASQVSIAQANQDQKVIKSINESIPAYSEKVYEFKIENSQMIQIQLNSGAVLLEKATYSNELNWPWENLVLFQFIELDSNGKPTVGTNIDFQQWKQLIQNYYKLEFTPIDDQKVSVLMKVTNPNESAKQ